MLVVLDSTDNPKLQELIRAFERAEGQVHVGDAAWSHLEAVAGKTMALFLERYVRIPIEWVLKDCPNELPSLTLSMDDGQLRISGSEQEFDGLAEKAVFPGRI